MRFETDRQPSAGDPEHGVDGAGNPARGDTGNQPPAGEDDPHEAEHPQHDVHPAREGQLRGDSIAMLEQAELPLIELRLAKLQSRQMIHLPQPFAGCIQRRFDRFAIEIVQAFGQRVAQLAAAGRQSTTLTLGAPAGAEAPLRSD